MKQTAHPDLFVPSQSRWLFPDRLREDKPELLILDSDLFGSETFLLPEFKLTDQTAVAIM